MEIGSGIARWLLPWALSLLCGCAGSRPLPSDAAARAESTIPLPDGVAGGEHPGWPWFEAGPPFEGGPGPFEGGPAPDLGPPPCPGQCIDNDPCTSDSCVNGQCVYDKIGGQIERYYNSTTGAHAYGPAGSGPAGFSSEGPVFRTLAAPAPGSATIYQQVGPSGDYMLSLSASEGIACCNYQNHNSIGHGFASQEQGTIPLYRLYHASSGLHLSSTSSSEGTQVGYSLEGVTVYVCPL
jgi:hypothetical protein